jgi:hypothetical protein
LPSKFWPLCAHTRCHSLDEGPQPHTEALRARGVRPVMVRNALGSGVDLCDRCSCLLHPGRAFTGLTQARCLARCARPRWTCSRRGTQRSSFRAYRAAGSLRHSKRRHLSRIPHNAPSRNDARSTSMPHFLRSGCQSDKNTQGSGRSKSGLYSLAGARAPAFGARLASPATVPIRCSSPRRLIPPEFSISAETPLWGLVRHPGMSDTP